MCKLTLFSSFILLFFCFLLFSVCLFVITFVFFCNFLSLCYPLPPSFSSYSSNRFLLISIVRVLLCIFFSSMQFCPHLCTSSSCSQSFFLLLFLFPLSLVVFNSSSAFFFYFIFPSSFPHIFVFSFRAFSLPSSFVIAFTHSVQTIASSADKPELQSTLFRFAVVNVRHGREEKANCAFTTRFQ